MKNKSRRTSVLVILGIIIFVVLNAILMPKLFAGVLAQTTEKVIAKEGSTVGDTIQVQGLNAQIPKPASTVEEYFKENMTQKEFDEISSYFDVLEDWTYETEIKEMGVSQHGTLRSYSYEKMLDTWTDAMWSRYRILSDQYVYDGLRPAEKLIWGVGDPNKIYFDYTNNDLHFPERELVDEDYLEFIDFEMRYSYVRDRRNGSIPMEEKMRQRTDIMSQEDAEKNARNIVESLYNVKTTDMDVEFLYRMYEGFEGFEGSENEVPELSVSIKPFRTSTLTVNGIDYVNYIISFDLYIGKFRSINASDTRRMFYNGEIPDTCVPLTKSLSELEKDEQLMETVKNALTTGLDEKREITKIEVLNGIASSAKEFYDAAGFVNLVVHLDDESGYDVQIYYDDLSVVDIRYNQSAEAILENWRNPVSHG